MHGQSLCFSSRLVKWTSEPSMRGAGRHKRRGKEDEWASLQSLKVPRGQRELETKPGRADQVGRSRARSRSRATRPACGRGWRMEASTTQGGSGMINRMMGADGRATRATLGTSLLLPSREPGQRLGAGMLLASGRDEAVVNESLAGARSLQASAVIPGGPANSLGVSRTANDGSSLHRPCRAPCAADH